MAYTGPSVVDYLKSTGQASDFGARTKLATQYGIKGYTGTGEQNTQLLGLLRSPAPSTPSAPTAPAVPNLSMAPAQPTTQAPVAPAPASPAPTAGNYTVKGGDTLSAIAKANNISLQDLLSMNPQYRANPNLIRPGEVVSLSSTKAPATSSPAIPTTIAPTINPETGGTITANIPGKTTPAVPSLADLFTSPTYESAYKGVLENLKPSQEEISAQEELNALNESLRQGYIGEGNRPIPLPFITGRQKALQTQQATLAEPIAARAALAQAKRTAALDVSKFVLEQEANKLSAAREASKPVSVGAGTKLINPLTGATVAEGTPVSDQQALDTVYNLAQTYPDANIQYDPALTPQENLKKAQAAAAQSPSFQARNTVYAINPLTGEPMIISKAGGGGTVFGGGSEGAGTTPVTLQNLAPELKGALGTVSGVNFFDASKVTSTQLPYLQRASSQLGIPILSKEDANKVQEAFQSFSSADALIGQISSLATPVLRASDDPVSQSLQYAKLKAIELAPALSTDNQAKQFIAARNSMLSLLTRAAGEKGVLTNQDVERIAQAMPGYSDSSTLARQKAINFSNVVNSVLQGAINAYIGSTGTISPSAGGGGGDALDAALDQLGFKSGGGGTPTATGMRTDRHNNPTAFTTAIARQAGLVEGVDYEKGDPFKAGNSTLYTARLLGNPVDQTIKVIDKIGFYTAAGQPRWTHTAMSKQAWDLLNYNEKAKVIAQMYQKEGGNALASIFKPYG